MIDHPSYDELKHNLEKLNIEFSDFKNQSAPDPIAIKPFASNFVHDFNNILAAILGHTEKALDTLPATEPAHQSLHHILKSTHRAKDLLNQVLLFFGLNKEEYKQIQVNHIIKNVLNDIKLSLPVNIDIQEDVTSEAITILAVPDHIRKVLMNLCTNACDAMKENGGVLKITLIPVEPEDQAILFFSGAHQNSYLRLSVSDTGTGMDPEIEQRIFEPYFTTKERAAEYGLGLSTVYGIIKKYGGFINVHTSLGEGTQFDIFLPKMDSKEQAETELAETIPRGTERILFVDDEKVLVDLAKFNMEELGYRIEPKTDPVEALAEFSENPKKFDLIITDMSMPNMTGEMLARAIMQIRPEIPIIICTGFSELMNEEKARSIGVRDFLMKPVTKRNLAKIIRATLDEKVKINL